MAREYQSSFAGGELAPKMHGRADFSKYAVCLAEAENILVEPEGPASTRPGTVFVAVVDGVNSITQPFKFDEDEQYVLVHKDSQFKVVKAGDLGYVQDAMGDFALATPYTFEQLETLKFVQRDDVMYLCHPLDPVQKLARLADDNWTLTPADFTPKQAAPTAPGAGHTVNATDTATADSVYKITAVSDDLEESLPTAEFGPGGLATDLGVVAITWTAAAGAQFYRIYKGKSGVFGFIGEATTTSFDDTGFAPETSQTPPSPRNPFDAVGDYPGVAARWQQRLVFGNTVNAPMVLQMSQTGLLENFTFSTPTRDTDAIELEPDSPNRAELRALITANFLLAFTDTHLFAVRPVDRQAARPGQLEAPIQLKLGCSPVAPLVVVNDVLFVEATGDRVLSTAYDVRSDQFIPTERSILSPHLFRGKSVRTWDYARSPYALVPTVMDDGALVVMTYHAEHDVYAWTRWTSHSAAGEAQFLWVTVVRENGRDVPYFLVRRVINGQIRVYLEKMADREEADPHLLVGADSAVIYDGAATTTITGLDHLEGETVEAVADGVYQPDLTVTSGQITLDLAASKVVVGLSVPWTMKTLPLRQNREKRKIVDRVYVDLYGETELEASGDNGASFDTRFGEGLQEIEVASDFEDKGDVILRGVCARPATVRQIITEFKYGG